MENKIITEEQLEQFLQECQRQGLTDDDLQVFLECLENDPGNVITRLLPLFPLAKSLLEENVSEVEYQSCLMTEFVEILEWVDDASNRSPDIKSSACSWLVYVSRCIGIGEQLWALLIDYLNDNCENVIENIRNADTGISPLDYIAHLLDNKVWVKLKFPPGDLLLSNYRVNSEKELRELSFLKKAIFIAKKGDSIERIYMYKLVRAFEKMSTSVREYLQGNIIQEIAYLSDTDDKPDDNSIGERFFHINDDDWLSQFCELAGVPMADFTDGGRKAIIDCLHKLDEGYEFASKKGISISASYGGQDGAERKARQRVFNKIKEASKKAQK
jgi:hypothetical protein